LLLRNTSKRDVRIRCSIYGKDASGKFVQFQLHDIQISPQSSIHIDLEKQRQLSRSNLADGAAGLRLTHDAAATDIVADLINIDESGDFVLYDDVRNLLLHQAAIQVAISFNLTNQNQSFIIMKNITDEPQQARVLLNHGDAKTPYDVK